MYKPAPTRKGVTRSLEMHQRYKEVLKALKAFEHEFEASVRLSRENTRKRISPVVPKRQRRLSPYPIHLFRCRYAPNHNDGTLRVIGGGSDSLGMFVAPAQISATRC